MLMHSEYRELTSQASSSPQDLVGGKPPRSGRDGRRAWFPFEHALSALLLVLRREVKSSTALGLSSVLLFVVRPFYTQRRPSRDDAVPQLSPFPG